MVQIVIRLTCIDKMTHLLTVGVVVQVGTLLVIVTQEVHRLTCTYIYIYIYIKLFLLKGQFHEIIGLRLIGLSNKLKDASELFIK